MVEEAKAVAAFIKEGGAYAGLALSLLMNVFLYKKSQDAQTTLLASERERRETIERDKDFHRQEMVNAGKDAAREIAELNSEWNKKLRHAERDHRTTSEGILPLVSEMIATINELEGFARKPRGESRNGTKPTRARKGGRGPEGPNDDERGAAVLTREKEKVGAGP